MKKFTTPDSTRTRYGLFDIDMTEGFEEVLFIS